MMLLEEVLEAHGGIERWRSARTIRARVCTGGLLPRTRMPGNRFADYRIEVDVDEPRAVAGPFPREGERIVFEDGAVRHETDGGELLAGRENPRPEFSGLSGLRRTFRWDVLDSAYFAGYAMWNYLTTPLLLTRDEVKVSEGEPWTAPGGETWRRLEASFDGRLDTHSQRQTFYFDEAGLLRRHDYVAETVGRWAHGAHHCADHTEVGGLVFPTRRWVRPIGPANRSMPFPTMVSLEIAEIEVDG